MYVARNGRFCRDSNPGISKKLLFLCIFVVLFSGGSVAAASSHQESLIMTLTPPLYQLSLAPGANWTSNLKFSNGNAYPLTVFVSVQNFQADDESGIALFPRTHNASSTPYELALWIKEPKEALTVHPGETVNIPFEINIPADAEPGGHYAAMIVGTGPEVNNDAVGLSVSSSISSLLYVRVAGKVIEEGTIADFSPEHWLVGSQEAKLHLRFFNTGNIHVEPEGVIDITNMFGKARGHIDMRESKAFGHILPHSTREFSFTWKGEKNFFDIGLYRARASVTYGENKHKTAYHSAYFLVFPWIPALSVITFLLGFGWFLRRGVAYYVVNALHEESVRREKRIASGLEANDGEGTIPSTFAVLRQPLINGVLDLSPNKISLQESNYSAHTVYSTEHTRMSKVAMFYLIRFRKYYSFVIFVLFFILGMLLIGWYIYQVFTQERSFQVTVEKDSNLK